MRFLAAIVATVVFAYAIGSYLTGPANAEISFWHEVVKRRDAGIAAVRAKTPATPLIFFTGGSSTAFSIDPAIIEKTCGLPTFNLGLPIAAGGKYLIHQALSKTRPGDVLVVCLEPDALTIPGAKAGVSKFSFALSTRDGRASEAAGGETFGEKPEFRDYLNLSRPGPAHVTTVIAKWIAGRGYRYTAADIRYRGRIETAVRNENLSGAGTGAGTSLTPEGRTLLETVVKAANQRGVRTIYSMPWQFTAKDSITASREKKRGILDEIRAIMPVAEDGYFGAAENRAWFSDSTQHLTAEGSQVRSQALGEALNKELAQATR